MFNSDVHGHKLGGFSTFFAGVLVTGGQIITVGKYIVGVLDTGDKTVDTFVACPSFFT